MKQQEAPLPTYNWNVVMQPWHTKEDYERRRFLYLEHKTLYELIDITPDEDAYDDLLLSVLNNETR